MLNVYLWSKPLVLIFRLSQSWPHPMFIGFGQPR